MRPAEPQHPAQHEGQPRPPTAFHTRSELTTSSAHQPIISPAHFPSTHASYHICKMVLPPADTGANTTLPPGKQTNKKGTPGASSDRNFSPPEGRRPRLRAKRERRPCPPPHPPASTSSPIRPRDAPVGIWTEQSQRTKRRDESKESIPRHTWLAPQDDDIAAAMITVPKQENRET